MYFQSHFFSSFSLFHAVFLRFFHFTFFFSLFSSVWLPFLWLQFTRSTCVHSHWKKLIVRRSNQWRVLLVRQGESGPHGDKSGWRWIVTHWCVIPNLVIEPIRSTLVFSTAIIALAHFRNWCCQAKNECYQLVSFNCIVPLPGGMAFCCSDRGCDGLAFYPWQLAGAGIVESQPFLSGCEVQQHFFLSVRFFCCARNFPNKFTQWRKHYDEDWFSRKGGSFWWSRPILFDSAFKPNPTINDCKRRKLRHPDDATVPIFHVGVLFPLSSPLIFDFHRYDSP